MIVLGVDQSYTGFGYSIHNTVDGQSKTSKMSFPMSKYQSQGDRLTSIAFWFENLIADSGCQHIVMEGYANAVKFGRELSGELGGQIKRVANEQGVPLIVVPPTTLKKFTTGKGNAKKNEMLLHVYKRWGAQFSDDNMADAFSLAKFGLAYHGVEIGATKEMLAVIEKHKKDQAKSK